MADPKGAHLFVNLSASQTRRRLKGVGLGVRQVQSVGRHQAMIIHTATGRHLEELEARFADVGFSGRASGLGEPVESLRNLGPTSAAWLRDIGAYTKGDLERLGPVVAYRLVKQRQPNTSLNLLWALAAALDDKDWRALSNEQKQRLLLEAEKDEGFGI